MRIRIKSIGKKQIGKYLEGNYIQPQTVGDVMNEYNRNLAEGMSKGDMVANAVGQGLNTAISVGGALLSEYGQSNQQDNKEQGGENLQQKELDIDYDDSNFHWQQNDNNNIPTSNVSGYNIESNDFDNQKNNTQLTIDTLGYNNYLRQQQIDEKHEQIKQKYPSIFQEEEYNPLDYIKHATGGNTSQLAEIERGEIVSTPNGNSIANNLMDYHRLYSDQNEQTGNIVNLTDNMYKDIALNPQLSRISKRINHYTSARRHGNTFIFPSTVGLNGKILEPKKGVHYPLAEYINNEYLA